MILSIGTIKYKLNITFILVALVTFFLTTFGDSIIFKRENYISSHKYIFAKTCAFLFLFIFWQVVAYLIHNIKEKKTIPRFYKFFAIYFFIMMLFLLLTWPGNWRWDELHVLNSAQELNWLYWQHWFTSLFFIFSLCLFPFPAGILIMQLFVISGIVGYIMHCLYLLKPTKYVYLFYMVFLLPSVISNNLYPFRSVLYSYFELLLFVLLLLKWIEKKPVCHWNMLVWSVLTAIVGSWRSEGVIYLIIIPLLIFLFFKTARKAKNVILFALVMGSLSGSIIFVQSQGGSDSKYFITGIQEPLAALLKTDINSSSLETDLDIINKILSVNSLQEKDGTSVFWEEGVKNYTPTEFNEFKKVYAKLVINNFPTFIKERIHFFFLTNSPPNGRSNSTKNPFILYDVTQENQPTFENFRKNFVLNQPLDATFRANIIALLECRGWNNYYSLTLLHNVLYNALPCIILMVVVMFYSLIKKKFFLVFLVCAELAKTALVVATAPATYFIYYFPTYLCGYGLGFILLFLYFGRKKSA